MVSGSTSSNSNGSDCDDESDCFTACCLFGTVVGRYIETDSVSDNSFTTALSSAACCALPAFFSPSAAFLASASALSFSISSFIAAVLPSPAFNSSNIAFNLPFCSFSVSIYLFACSDSSFSWSAPTDAPARLLWYFDTLVFGTCEPLIDPSSLLNVVFAIFKAAIRSFKPSFSVSVFSISSSAAIRVLHSASFCVISTFNIFSLSTIASAAILRFSIHASISPRAVAASWVYRSSSMRDFVITGVTVSANSLVILA